MNSIPSALDIVPKINCPGDFGDIAYIIPNLNKNLPGFMAVSFCQIKNCGYDNLSHTSNDFFEKYKLISHVPGPLFINKVLSILSTTLDSSIMRPSYIRAVLTSELSKLKKQSPHIDSHTVFHDFIDLATYLIN